MIDGVTPGGPSGNMDTAAHVDSPTTTSGESSTTPEKIVKEVGKEKRTRSLAKFLIQGMRSMGILEFGDSAQNPDKKAGVKAKNTEKIDPKLHDAAAIKPEVAANTTPDLAPVEQVSANTLSPVIPNAEDDRRAGITDEDSADYEIEDTPAGPPKKLTIVDDPDESTLHNGDREDTAADDAIVPPAQGRRLRVVPDLPQDTPEEASVAVGVPAITNNEPLRTSPEEHVENVEPIPSPPDHITQQVDNEPISEDNSETISSRIDPPESVPINNDTEANLTQSEQVVESGSEVDDIPIITPETRATPPENRPNVETNPETELEAVGSKEQLQDKLESDATDAVKVTEPGTNEVLPPPTEPEVEPIIDDSTIKSYRATLNNRTRREFDDAQPEKQLELTTMWLAKLAQDRAKAEPGEVTLGTKDFGNYIRHLEATDPEALKEFGRKSNEEREQTVIDFKKEQAKLEIIDEVAARRAQHNQRLAGEEEVVVRVLPPSEIEEQPLTKFINALTDQQYKAWKKLPQEKRDEAVGTWEANGETNWHYLEFIYLQLEGAMNPREWKALSPEQQEAVLNDWKQTPDFKMLDWSLNRIYKDMPRPSLELMEMAEMPEKAHDADGKPTTILVEKLVGVVARKRGLYSIMTHEEQKQAQKETRRARGIKNRILDRWASFLYVNLNRLFDIERVIAENNKKQQEYIRSIVDTGPDNNERWIFAQKNPEDGEYYLIDGATKVDGHTVEKLRHLVLHNPSKFQALCHYELSKQPEHLQQKTWDAIFSLLAEEGYDKYAMFGVAIGLQFMNKPQYLAMKNTAFDYTPIYEEQPDEHGHMQPVTDPQTNQRVVKYYDESTIYRTNKLGLRVRVRDPHGKQVNVGDVMRDYNKISFETMDLELHEFDQEYYETGVDGVTPMYKELTRIKYRNKLDENNRVIGREAYEEKYKVKRILKVKPTAYAHEIAGKFMSYQYGFRGSDVSVALDFTRYALYKCTSIAEKYPDLIGTPAKLPPQVFKELQEYMLVLNRMNMAVSASRMGGSPGEDGKGPAASAMNQMQDEIILRSQQDNTPRTQNGRAVYPPRISGTAEAIRLWEMLAQYVDTATRMFPRVGEIRTSDFEAYQDPYATRNQEPLKHHERVAA